MKRLFLPVAAALMMLAGACSTDSFVLPIVEEDETLKDELYAPDVLIDQVAMGVADKEQWIWDGNSLQRIDMTGDREGTVTFKYNDEGRVRKVTNTTNGERVINYTYADGKMHRYTVTVDGDQQASVSVTRNGEGRIGGADITFSGRYVLDMIERFRNGDNSLITARPAWQPALQQLANTLEEMGVVGESLDKDNQNFHLTLNWYNGNVASEVLSGTVQLEIDPQRVVEDLTLLPDELRSMVYLYLSTHNQLPVKVSFSNVVTYTFDDNKNPYHGYLGDGITARNLSKNNILTARTNGNSRVTLTLFGRDITLSNRQVEKEVSLTYLYNNEGYPVQIAGDGLTVISYK